MKTFFGNIYSLQLNYHFWGTVPLSIFGTVQETKLQCRMWTSRQHGIARILQKSDEVSLIKTVESKIRYVGFLKLSLYARTWVFLKIQCAVSWKFPFMRGLWFSFNPFLPLYSQIWPQWLQCPQPKNFIKYTEFLHNSSCNLFYQINS